MKPERNNNWQVFSAVWWDYYLSEENIEPEFCLVSTASWRFIRVSVIDYIKWKMKQTKVATKF